MISRLAAKGKNYGGSRISHSHELTEIREKAFTREAMKAETRGRVKGMIKNMGAEEKRYAGNPGCIRK